MCRLHCQKSLPFMQWIPIENSYLFIVIIILSRKHWNDFESFIVSMFDCVTWYWCMYFITGMFVWQERALNYLSSCIDQVTSFGDILQLVIVELIYKVSNWWISEWISIPFLHGRLYSLKQVILTNYKSLKIYHSF